MRSLILILLFFSSSLMLAQTKPVINNAKRVDSRSNLKTQPNPWRVGGGLGLNMGNNNYFGVSVAPFVGYQALDYLEVGVAVGYQYASQKNLKQHLFHGGPYVHFYPVPEFFARLQYEYYTGSSKVKGALNSVNRSENALWVGAGYRNTGPVSFYAGIMYNVLYKSDSHFFSNGFRPIAGVSVRL